MRLLATTALIATLLSMGQPNGDTREEQQMDADDRQEQQRLVPNHKQERYPAAHRIRRHGSVFWRSAGNWE